MFEISGKYLAMSTKFSFTNKSISESLKIFFKAFMNARLIIKSPIQAGAIIRILGLSKQTKLYQASTSELYGLVQEVPQNEKTPFNPISPYSILVSLNIW